MDGKQTPKTIKEAMDLGLLDPEQIPQIRELRAEGLRDAEIIEELRNDSTPWGAIAAGGAGAAALGALALTPGGRAFAKGAASKVAEGGRMAKGFADDAVAAAPGAGRSIRDAFTHEGSVGAGEAINAGIGRAGSAVKDAFAGAGEVASNLGGPLANRMAEPVKQGFDKAKQFLNGPAEPPAAPPWGAPKRGMGTPAPTEAQFDAGAGSVAPTRRPMPTPEAAPGPGGDVVPFPSKGLDAAAAAPAVDAADAGAKSILERITPFVPAGKEATVQAQLAKFAETGDARQISSLMRNLRGSKQEKADLRAILLNAINNPGT